MSYTDRYREYLDSVNSIVAFGKKNSSVPMFAFTSNLDIVLRMDSERYNEILDQYLKGEPSVREGDTMDTMEDFARISAYYIKRGLGANFDITSEVICSSLRHCFDAELSLGGTGAQGAAALGAMGIPVSVHITDDCREVCDMMNYPGITTIKDHAVVPIMRIATENTPVSHFILQFNKGDRIRICGKEFVIPSSNRLILFYDKMQKEVPLQEDFLQYWENTEKAPVSILCSGFDAIIDTGLFQKKLDRLKTFIERILKKDPSVILYMESAFYMNNQVKTMFFESLSGYGAVIGMNEEELTAQLESLGMEICIERPDEIISGLNLLLDRFSARGVVLHTKDYSVYYGAELKGIDIESGLTMGNLMSATRARIGHYGTQDECCKTLELELSDRGLQMYDAFAELPLRKFCCVVPTRYMEYPKYTIGLGDTFVAGVHTCFMQRTCA